ncbi:4-hydroxy-2-oxoheptanedioate aldolase [Oricola thermophila]|uniref:4-hydroxy-2-oxoheptanedioate aldolase n=1 Tax=Oricola thermophila TaxID=2742145 RepID=A0A6N1VKK0_9HYPH|nr:4-hydroxy-2-oxoheptanedioate aldolase [Oricola thermophila]QKV20295.1 4-hydroxy-2-oxoheptanedioate aldolase [Oricola thermophila]
MPAPVNEFKAALSRGERQVGCWLGLADAYAAEIMGTAGFDWLLIDGEHAPNDLRSILAQLQALEASPSHSVVRLPIGETWMIKQVLDLGAQNILVPMVESGEQAAALVKAVRYPPRGVRGVGSALARASRFSGISDYLTTADDEICLLVQVENRAGMAALDDILAVEGIDGVFIGPADLAADMGHIGKPGTPEVQEAIAVAIGRIHAAGRASGILATDPAAIDTYAALGVTFIAVGIDVVLLAGAARKLAKQYGAEKK